MPILIQMVSIKVKPEHLAEFKDAFRINYEGTLQEPGNIRFDVLCDPSDPTNISIYEVFESAEALEEHRCTPHYKECVRLIAPMIQGTRTKVYYEPLMTDFLDHAVP